MVEGGSGMEGSSIWRMASERSDMVEADFEKIGCGEG